MTSNGFFWNEKNSFVPNQIGDVWLDEITNDSITIVSCFNLRKPLQKYTQIFNNILNIFEYDKLNFNVI